MVQLHNPDMTLAGFFAQLCLSKIIYRASDDTWNDSVICRKEGILWFLLVTLSIIVGFITAIKNKENKLAQGLLTFVGSLILNFSGDNLGYLTLYCTKHHYSYYFNFSSHQNTRDIYTYCTIPIMGLASIIIMANILKKVCSVALPREATEDNTNRPDPEIILLGVCLQFTVIKIVYVTPARNQYDFLCAKSGLGSWLELLAVSGILIIFTCMKTSKRCRVTRSLLTFFGSFIIHLTIGGIGSTAITCASPPTEDTTMYITRDYITLILNGISALILIVLKNNPPRPQNPDPPAHIPPAHIPPAHISGVIVAPHAPPYPGPPPASISTSPPTPQPHPRAAAYTYRPEEPYTSTEQNPPPYSFSKDALPPPYSTLPRSSR